MGKGFVFVFGRGLSLLLGLLFGLMLALVRVPLMHQHAASVLANAYGEQNEISILCYHFCLFTMIITLSFC